MYFSQNSEENWELQDINSELHEKSWNKFISIWEKKCNLKILRKKIWVLFISNKTFIWELWE